MHEVVLIIHTTASLCSQNALKNQMTDHTKGRKVNENVKDRWQWVESRFRLYGYN